MCDFTIMKISQSDSISSTLQAEAAQLGQLLARLRKARQLKQTDVAARAGLSRNTIYRLEHGDPGLAFGQILRYLDAVAPGATLKDLYAESDPALAALTLREQTRRVRDLSSADLEALDF
ncbi:transcription factor [Pandoraea pneumonica]|uniref:Transcription factor n=2 Tax=Pandoraea pneumonica TaxID=2508299 RepID=A0A5E4WGQ1_9BURK|nr:transcription factor [Pandoraea pneumonica]